MTKSSQLAPLALALLAAACGDHRVDLGGDEPADAGSAGADAGGSVPDAGGCRSDCRGDTLVLCENGQETTTDCRTAMPGARASCGLVDAQQADSHDCLLPVGSPCLAESGGDWFPLPCAGTEPGCVLRGSDRCEQHVGRCVAADVGTCRGNLLVVECLASQPTLASCTDQGLTCSAGACRGVPENGACVPGLFECSAGAQCLPGWDGKHTCVADRPDECPGGCATPPPPACRWDDVSATGRFLAIEYGGNGLCVGPAECSYPRRKTTTCAEACVAGACVPGPSCSLSTSCGANLGCKTVTDTELRCIPVDDLRTSEPCDDEVVGYRCASHFKCVWPSFETTSVCARLCLANADCGGGLRGQGLCVKDGTAGSRFGYCK